MKRSSVASDMRNHENDPNSIKYHVKKFLVRHQERFRNKIVVDMPAGNGVTSRLLKDIGAFPLAFDLFPEYFVQEGINCTRANVLELPLADKHADFVICQEGIEHFTDQFKSLTEFNRILKPGGSLIITTPNYSNLRARLSYFLSESERFNSIMPPNEIDSIWMNDQSKSSEIYFGHVFLIGIQKLRVLANLSGFKIKHIQLTRLKTTSLLLFPFVYPFIFLSNLFTYLKHVNREKGYPKVYQKEVYGEIFRLGIAPKILLYGHLFVEFEKVSDFDQVMGKMKSVQREFGCT